MALTAAIAEVLPGFTRADWRLHPGVFTARCVRAAEAPPAPSRPLLPALAAPGTDTASTAARHGGLWLLLHASVLTPERPSLVGVARRHRTA